MRIYNEEATALRDALDGLLFLRQGACCAMDTPYGYALYRHELAPEKVRIIIGGGGGLGPMWAGFCEAGLADAVVHGEFDCAPNAYVLYEMAKRIEDGAGVIFLLNHYMGDYLNADLAVELLAHDGVRAAAVYAKDDMCSAGTLEKEQRGGLCGIALLCKIAWRAAQEGKDIDEICRLVNLANIRLLSVSACIDTEEAIVAYGRGFSGEAPVKTLPYINCRDFVEKSLAMLLGELGETEGGSAALLINPMARMSFTESMVVLKEAAACLDRRGLSVEGASAGNYFDVFDGKGCMFTLLLLRPEYKDYMAPVFGVGFTV